MDKYKAYALSVVNNEIITSNYVKKACQRYLEFFDKYDFNTHEADRIISFISKLKHWTGSHNGKPFELLPYQKWLTWAVFCFYHKGTNRRVTNIVYIELARKNGKTALVSAWIDYLLVASGESGAELDMIANSAKQAKICFDMSSNFLESIDKKNKYFKRYRDKIKFPQTKSFIQVLSSDTSKLDGGNPLCWVLDEVHEQKDSKAYDVMVSGQGMRENPLGIMITTAGFNQTGFCYQFRKSVIDILSGLVDNDSVFGAIYSLDEDDDWTDPNLWIKANPSLGQTVQVSYLEQQVKQAKANASLETGTRTKNFNQWVSSIDVWISNDLIREAQKPIDLTDYQGSYCYVGVDLSAVSDLTAVSVLIPQADKFIFKTFYYLPKSCLSDNSNSELYKLWHKKKYITITSGNVVDYDYITKDLMNLNQTLILEKIAYDQWNSTQWAIDATALSLPLEPYSQAIGNFNKPTKELERLIRSQRVIIDNNPITNWCFENVTIKEDWNQNIKPIKTSHQMKIDGVIAMIEALGIYLTVPHYDNSGIL